MGHKQITKERLLAAHRHERKLWSKKVSPLLEAILPFSRYGMYVATSEALNLPVPEVEKDRIKLEATVRDIPLDLSGVVTMEAKCLRQKELSRHHARYDRQSRAEGDRALSEIQEKAGISGLVTARTKIGDTEIVHPWRDDESDEALPLTRSDLDTLRRSKPATALAFLDYYRRSGLPLWRFDRSDRSDTSYGTWTRNNPEYLENLIVHCTFNGVTLSGRRFDWVQSYDRDDAPAIRFGRGVDIDAADDLDETFCLCKTKPYY